MLPVASWSLTYWPNWGELPTPTILPSLTAITGEPFLAKIEVPLVLGLESIAMAALVPLILFLESLTTEESAYLAGAATGKWPSTRPVSAPMSCDGMPPISLARSSTDWTYQPAWL